MSAAATTYRLLKRVVIALIEPLKTDDSIEHFTLAIPEAQTTTVDSVQGWVHRPAALLGCPGCDAEIPQRRATSNIDCPNCYRVYKPHEFSDLELHGMFCPRCRTEMRHGIRHPEAFDHPEWATCPNCQYHWDLDHWF